MLRVLAFIALTLAALAPPERRRHRPATIVDPLTCLFSPFLQPQRPMRPPQSGEPLDLAAPGDQEEPPEAAPPEQYEVSPSVRRQYASLYAAMDAGRFPIPAVRLSDIDPRYLRQIVYFPTREQPGTLVIDPHDHFLYRVEGGGRATRYGVGVGSEGFGWSGIATIHDKQEWPDWYPPKEMLPASAELMRQMSELQSGLGMPGGPRNPLGARAMYLWQGNRTRSTAFTARSNPGRSARASPPAASA